MLGKNSGYQNNRRGKGFVGFFLHRAFQISKIVIKL